VADRGRPRRVALIGFMASGKTTVGRLLAGILDWEFVDVDELVESAAGTTIGELFRSAGEAAFRRAETSCLLGLASRSRLVVACGGGAPMRDENLPFFTRRGTTVFHLHCPLEVALARAEGGPERPLLAGGRAEAARLYAERIPRYRSLGVEIDATAGGPREVAEAIARRVAPG
jgi:shikimate kinase